MSRSGRSLPASDEALSQLVRLAQASMPGGDTVPEQAGLVRFEQAIARRTLRRKGRLFWVFGFGAALAGAGFAIATVGTTAPALSLTVVKGTVSDGGYVRADNQGGTELRFSDGSNVVLDRGTRTRVTELDARGGHVLIESGHARVKVTPRPRARWTVDAGPYSVRVVGTEFDIQWSANDELFDVHLQKGAIVVKGPLAPAGIAMEAGQHLVANVRKGEIFLDGELSAGRASAGAPSAAAEQEEGAAGRQAAEAGPRIAPEPQPIAPFVVRASRGKPGAAVRPPPQAQDPSWSKRIVRGDFHGVLADAERRGIDTTLETAPAGDLTALADAARYVRRRDLARRALLAERARFAGSLGGRDAAFFLGGVSEDDSGGAAAKSALDWYDVYLRESPQGNYVPQALGRKMVLVQRLHGVEAARPVAEAYLGRFPNGPYAAAARKLVGAR